MRRNAFAISVNEEKMSILNESLIYEVLSVVEEIPEGKVASYGQIASLIGRGNIIPYWNSIIYLWN